MRALVQSGGGSKGAYQVGVLSRWLGKEEREYDLFAGVSVGAINAAGLAQFQKGQEKLAYEWLRDLWLSFGTKDVYKRWFPLGKVHGLWRPALYNSSPLRKLLEKHFDRDKLIRSGKLLRLGVVSLNSGEYRAFDETVEDLVGAVLASASYPAFLLPIEVEGELYSDGGVRNVTPLKAAIDAGATEVDVIMTQPYPPHFGPLDDPNALDVALRVVAIMTSEIVEGDLKQALLINELAKAGQAGPGKRYVKIRVVRPSSSLHSSSLTFEHEKICAMMARGAEDADLLDP